MKGDKESNIEYEEECQHHDDEESTGKDDEHSISYSGNNREIVDAGYCQSKDSVREYQKSFETSTRSEEGEYYDGDENNHAELSWQEDSIKNFIHEPDQRDAADQDHEDSLGRADHS